MEKKLKKIWLYKKNIVTLYRENLINFLIKNNMLNTKKIIGDVRVVYDINLDGTVVNALGRNIMSNTDG